MITADRHAPMVAATFAELIGNASAQHASQWTLSLRDTPVIARLDDGWLVMTAPAEGVASLADLLAWNPTLPGLAKLALSRTGVPQLRAEIPLDENAADLIRESAAGFDHALALLAGVSSPPASVENAAAIPRDDLQRACEQIGWSAAARGDDALALELECPGSYIQASLAPRRGGIRISVQLANLFEAEPECISSIGALLLTTCGVVRMARPISEVNEGRAWAGLEVAFSAFPSPGRLAHALSGLSIACQLCAEEAKALLSPDLARELLALTTTITITTE